MLPKSPLGEWVPYLSSRPLDEHDLHCVAQALGQPIHAVCQLSGRFLRIAEAS
jgi:hypothetical protein